MTTLAEVKEMLAKLEAEQGREAAQAWVLANAKDLPEDVRNDIVFEYSVDAAISDAKTDAVIAGVVAEATETLDTLETAKREIAAELEKREVRERLDGNAGA